MTVTASEETKPKFLQATIDTSKLSLGDWLAICDSRQFKPRWAYEAWIEAVDKDSLSELTLEDWEAVAEELEFKEGWAYHRYKEYRKAR